MTPTSLYQNGDYFRIHPDWHLADSNWKGRQIMKMLNRHRLSPSSVAEIGCGAGGILESLQRSLDPDCELWGYEISPQALQLCSARAREKLHFVQGGAKEAEGRYFDVLLAMDVVEHVPDYIEFLHQLKPLARAKVFHVPLDLSVQGLMRNIPGRLRKTAGHLHYFTKPLFLQSLEEAGYRVKDCFYTLPAIEGSWSSPASRLARGPRQLAFAINEDWAALILGGCSLLVYAV